MKSGRFLLPLRFLFLCFLFSFSKSVEAQTIFPGLSGQELLDSLVAKYKTATTLGYSIARDRMYGIIDNHNDSVSCVYTDYTIYVPYNAPNPRDYTNGATPIINAEHTWPQSKGAVGIAKSDLHHMFPTNEVANSARASLPFHEIADSQTDKWYRKTSVLSQIPSQLIDEYSELEINLGFEPREDHKGNVARAMFYFYTMYRAEANSADPNFFNAQKNALRAWNSLDPVDSAEIVRTQLIATYQEGKPNPFVLDTSLIGRAYFGVTGISTQTAVFVKGLEIFPNYPNPFNPSTTISFNLPHSGVADITVYQIDGKEILQYSPGRLPAGENRYQLNMQDRATGTYLIRIKYAGQSKFQKILLLK